MRISSILRVLAMGAPRRSPRGGHGGCRVETLERRRLLSATGVNLVANPSFTLGNKDFTTGLKYGSIQTYKATYVVGTNPIDFDSKVASFGDHTTGKGLMMIVDGTTHPTTTIWQESIAVNAGETYTFTGWVASWDGATGQSEPSPAKLNVSVNGTVIINTYAPAKVAQWAKITGTWKSPSAETVTLRIIDQVTATVGNDFTLDDLSFSTPNLNGAISGTVFNDLNADGKKDGSDSGVAGWLVYVDANNNGQYDAGETSTVTSSTGAFSLTLAPGTYVIRVEVRNGYYETAPATLGYTIKVTAGSSTTGELFGMTAISPP